MAAPGHILKAERTGFTAGLAVRCEEARGAAGEADSEGAA